MRKENYFEVRSTLNGSDAVLGKCDSQESAVTLARETYKVLRKAGAKKGDIHIALIEVTQINWKLPTPKKATVE